MTSDLPRASGGASFGEKLVGWCSDRPSRAAAVLLLLSLCLFLPGFFTLPPTDRDESRYIQATKQMVETGNYIDIRLQDRPRHKKPVGIYWLQSAAVTLSGQGAEAPVWVYRMPSLIAACLTVLLTFWIGSTLFGRRTAFIGAALLASTILLGVEARLAKTDAALLATILIAHGALARIYLTDESGGNSGTRTWTWPLIFWVSVGAGVLIKLPIIVYYCGLTVLALTLADRNLSFLRRLKPLYGMPVALLVVLPWLVAIMIVTKGAFFSESIAHDFLGKVYQSQESHGAPPGTYLAAFFGTFMPAAAIAVLALPWVWAQRKQRAVRFCLAWIIPAWIGFEIALTKLPHYVLPTYPAIALLLAFALTRGELSASRWLVWPAAIWGVIIAAVLAIGPLAGLHLSGGTLSPVMILAAVLAVGLGLAAGYFLLHNEAGRALAASIAAMAVLYMTVYGAVVPGLTPIWLSPRLEAAIERHRGRCAKTDVASAGYHEPSLVFLVGTDVKLTDGKGAADFIVQDSCRLALIDARHQEAFQQALKAAGHRPELVETIKGLNYNGFRKTRIGIYRSAG